MAAITSARAGFRGSQKWQTRLNVFATLVALTLLAIVVVGIPMGWMVTTALKDRTQIFA